MRFSRKEKKDSIVILIEHGLSGFHGLTRICLRISFWLENIFRLKCGSLPKLSNNANLNFRGFQIIEKLCSLFTTERTEEHKEKL